MTVIVLMCFSLLKKTPSSFLCILPVLSSNTSNLQNLYDLFCVASAAKLLLKEKFY